MRMITIEDDRQFLMAQRDGMKGCIEFELSQVKKRKRIGQQESQRRNKR